MPRQEFTLISKTLLSRILQKTKQLKVNKFKGIKSIPLSSIIVHDMSLPRQCKIDCAVESIQRDGGVATPIYVGLCGDKYLLKEGLVWYLAARQCGLSSILATMEWKCVKRNKL